MVVITRILGVLFACTMVHAATQNVTIHPIHTTIGTPIYYTAHMPHSVSKNTWNAIHQTLSAAIHVEALTVTQNTLYATFIPFALGPVIIPSIDLKSRVIPSQIVDISSMTHLKEPKLSSTLLTTNTLPFPYAYWQLLSPLWLLALIPIFMARRRPPYILPKPLYYIVALPGILRTLMPLIFRLSLALIVVGIAHPVYYVDHPVHTQVRSNIMIILDTSNAMQTIDFKPQHRLKNAQLLLNDWLNANHYDRVGLIVLGAHPHTVVPLTRDHSLVKQAIANRTYDDVGSPPNVGLALAMAIHRLRMIKGPKRIVLLSSGSQLDSPTTLDPIKLAKIAKHQSIAIDTIGFGSPTGAYQIVNNPTYKKLYRRNAKNAIVSTYRNDTEFNSISHISQGHAFKLSKTQDITALIDALHALTSPKSTLAYQTRQQSFQVISIGLGTVLAIISMLIQWRRPWGHY